MNVTVDLLNTQTNTTAARCSHQTLQSQEREENWRDGVVVVVVGGLADMSTIQGEVLKGNQCREGDPSVSSAFPPRINLKKRAHHSFLCRALMCQQKKKRTTTLNY